jgi:hypothetical protein
MGHDVQNIIKDCRSTNELHCIPDYTTITKPDRLMHVMKMLYLDSKQNPPNSPNPDYDGLWQIRRTFDYLINTYSTLYRSTETLVWVEVIVYLCIYIYIKHNRFGMQVHNFVMAMNTYNTTAYSYLGKQLLNAASNFFLNNQPDALIIPILFCCKTTCFGHPLCPSSGVFYCTTFHPDSAWKRSSESCMKLTSAECTVEYS